MLGVAPRDIDAVWGLVAAATARGELGFSAKVAPGLGAEAAPNLLICVYLRDFNRRDDVRRVLRRLDALLPPPPATCPANNKSFSNCPPLPRLQQLGLQARRPHVPRHQRGQQVEAQGDDLFSESRAGLGRVPVMARGGTSSRQLGGSALSFDVELFCLCLLFACLVYIYP